MNLGFEPESLDWNIAKDSYSFDIISSMMVGLTRFGEGEDGEVISVPACAARWDINEDSSEFTFYLNPKAKWSDGVTVTAQHFVDSFRRLLDPKTAAPYADLLSIIDLEQTHAVDERTLFIKLKRPAAYFLGLTSYGLTLPIRLDLIERYGDSWTEPENIVGNGPYNLKVWQHEYKIVLERNEDFFLDKPELKYLKFFMVPEQSSAYTLFENGQFDWVDGRSIPNSEMRALNFTVDCLDTTHASISLEEQNVIDKKNYQPNCSKLITAHKASKVKLSRIPLLRSTYIGFNTRKKPFSDPKVRRAFAYAINRELVTKVLNRGDIANSTFIPPGLAQFYDPSIGASYDPDYARDLLAEAGYPDGNNFPEIEFLLPSNEAAKLLSETLQSMWKKELSINTRLISMEWKVFLDTLGREPPDIYRLNWGADYPDPDTFMQLFTTNSPINYTGWSSKEYDKLVIRAASLTDVAKRKKLYNQAQQLLTQKEMPITPLFVNSQTILIKEGVSGLYVNPLDIVFLDKVTKN